MLRPLLLLNNTNPRRCPSVVGRINSCYLSSSSSSSSTALPVITVAKRNNIRPRNIIRQFSTRPDFDLKQQQQQHPRDCSCCCQTRQYTTTSTRHYYNTKHAPILHSHIIHHPLSSSIFSSFNHSSQQQREKSDDATKIDNGDDDGNGNDTAVVLDKDHEGEEAEDAAMEIPGAQKGGKKLAIVFTCTVCDTRSAKQFTENAYRNGVVIVTCPGCQNRHLIADNLEFFEDDSTGGWNIEKAVEKMGENVKLVTNDNVLEVSVEDLFGKDKIQAATENVGNK